MSDIFKEVDEDIRRDQYKKLWDRFGPYVIGGAVLIVAATAGFRGWEYWQDQRAEASGDRFIAAIEAAEAGSHEDALTRLQEIVETGSGDYPVLARFRIATELAAAGDEAGAISQYDAVAASSGVADEVKNIARLRAAFILVDTSSTAELQDRIGDLAATGNPWRHTARELIGLSAWRSGQYKLARDFFTDITVDQETPNDLRQRGNVMLSLIRARIGEPAVQAGGG